MNGRPDSMKTLAHVCPICDHCTASAQTAARHLRTKHKSIANNHINICDDQPEQPSTSSAQFVSIKSEQPALDYPDCKDIPFLFTTIKTEPAADPDDQAQAAPLAAIESCKSEFVNQYENYEIVVSKPFQITKECPRCEQKIISALERHHLNLCQTKLPFQCDHCPRAFADKVDLLIHQANAITHKTTRLKTETPCFSDSAEIEPIRSLTKRLKRPNGHVNCTELASSSTSKDDWPPAKSEPESAPQSPPASCARCQTTFMNSAQIAQHTNEFCERLFHHECMDCSLRCWSKAELLCHLMSDGHKASFGRRKNYVIQKNTIIKPTYSMGAFAIVAQASCSTHNAGDVASGSVTVSPVGEVCNATSQQCTSADATNNNSAHLKCLVCSFTSASKSTLESHFYFSHSKVFPCPNKDCQVHCSVPYQLKLHLDSCPFLYSPRCGGACSFVAKSKLNLCVHRASHVLQFTTVTPTGPAPHIFTQETPMLMPRPFKSRPPPPRAPQTLKHCRLYCDVCEKDFESVLFFLLHSNRECLKQRMWYKCDFCSEMFRHSRLAVIHLHEKHAITVNSPITRQ